MLVEAVITAPAGKEQWVDISYTLPLSISADSRLTDDVLLVAPVSIDPAAAPGTAVAVDENGHPTILAVTPGTGAAELRSSADSASGLTVAPLPGGKGATEIICLTDQAGLLHALYATGSAVLHTQRDADGSWSTPDTLPAGSGLAATQVPLSGDTAVCAVDADGNVVLYTAAAGKWSGQTVDVHGALRRGSARVQYLSPDAWVMFGVAEGKLLLWSGTGTTVASGPETVAVAAPVASILFTYQAYNSAMAVFTDGQHTLYSTVGFSDKPQAIPLATVVRGTGCVGDDGLIRCYGCDPDGTLWVLRQTAWGPGGRPQWAPIFPLDTEAADVASPVGGSGALVVTRADGSIDLLSQPGGGGPWRRVPVHADSPAVPMRTPRYRTRLTVTDAAGRVCAGVPVTLTPDRLVALTSGTGSVTAAPGRPATLTTGPAGRVEFSQPGTGLQAVTLTASTPRGAAPLHVAPHDYLNPVLGGHADLFTGTAAVPAMSKDTLLNATVGGQPLVPEHARDLADAAARGIKSAASFAAGTTTMTGFEVDLRDPAAPRFRAYHSAGDLAESMAAYRAADLGGFWDSISEFGPDVLNAISSGAMRLAHLAVDLVNNVVSATVQFTDEITARLKDIALDGLAQVPALIHGIFHAIGAALGRVLDWLKDQLHWDSVWRTMDAFHGYLDAAFDAAVRLLEKSAVVKTGKFFADRKAEVNSAFDAAIAAVGDRTLNGSRSAAPPALPGGNPLQQDWVLNQLFDHLPDRSFFGDGGLAAGVVEQALGQLRQAIADSGLEKDGADALASLELFFAEWFPHPDQIGQARAADLLRVVQTLADLVLDAADVIATVILDVIADLLSAVEATLDSPLTDSPALTWIWENLARPSWSNDEMTLGRLFCLAFAAPVSTLYLAAKGHGPYDPGLARATASVTAAKPWHGPPDVFEPLEFYASVALIPVDIRADTVNLASDATDDAVVKFALITNLADVVANAIVQFLAWPDQPFIGDNVPWDWSAMSRSDQILNGTWIAYWAPIAVDGILTGVGELVPGRASFLVNVLLDRMLGTLLVIGGVTGSGIAIHDGEDTSAADLVTSLLGPLPWVGQPLLVREVVEASQGLSPFVQYVVDVIGDFNWPTVATL